ncbi:unnamed protein product [Bursaphelenchus xylophilus]|uniref:(pine wood nematode) hypothetical protein n=1 Tax=Bursaphelenchus xylophilus TaxID=6326 RepID=A0A1I7SDB4_BURXY|nr:unnamed protein product [Bursaphelenchus xylophilus]CAG9130579.1 unnamed protein product [Bursaphelenchus xylophilus]
MLLILAVLISIPFSICLKEQSIGVKGRFLCGSAPLANAVIKLMNKNKIGMYDILDTVQTSENGSFETKGTINSVFGMDVKVNVAHDCDRHLPCQRTFDFYIPSKYISRSTDVQKWFYLGKWNLEVILPEEESNCIN